MPNIALVLDNIRSANNVGSIFRTADAFGVKHIYLCGITPYPEQAEDSRLPHIRRAASDKIAKTALGAERYIDNSHAQSTLEIVKKLKNRSYQILALEQVSNSIPLVKKSFSSQPIALVVGNEISGISKEVLNAADQVLEIPMLGKKESLNVAVATGIALFALAH